MGLSIIYKIEKVYAKLAGIRGSTMQRPDMFYGAPPHIFEKARELRKNMTQAEKILWHYLKKRQLKGSKFRRQHPISEFIIDFYCRTAKLVVEVDGDIHQLEEQQDYDLKRSDKLNEYNIRVLRFTNEEVIEEIEQVLEEIKSCL